MGFSIITTHAIFGVTFLIIMEIVVVTLLPTFLDLKDSHEVLIDRSIDQINTDIDITGIIPAGEEQEWNNSVDSNTTDVDSSPDIGIETNFPNAQDVAPDSNNMTIQENFTGSWAVDEWLNVSSYTGDYQGWDTRVDNGDATYLLAADDDITTHSGSYIHESANANRDEGWFTFNDTSEIGSSFTVNFTFRVASADADNDGFIVYYDTSGGSGIEGPLVAINSSDTYVYRTVTLPGSFTATQVNAMRIYLHTDNDLSGGDRWVDHCRMSIYSPSSPNYEIDVEYNWTTANYSEAYKEVCIYVDSHIGGEDLNVNYWNGESWVSLGTISSTGWSNFTATGLDSLYYTIQLIGDSESSDISQDSWGIDCIFLHTWNYTWTSLIVKNTGSTIIETDDFNILINGVITSFTCQKSFIDLNSETTFIIDTAVTDQTRVKIITKNGISDYRLYIS